MNPLALSAPKIDPRDGTPVPTAAPTRLRTAEVPARSVLPAPGLATRLAGPQPSRVDPDAPRAAAPRSRGEQTRVYDLRDVTPEGLTAALRTLRSDPTVTLDADAVKGLATLSGAEKRMVAATLNRLAAVKAGTLSSPAYMIAVMSDAAAIAGEDRVLFCDLVGFAFCEGQTKWFETARRWLGAGYRPVGSTLERTFHRLTHKPGGQAGYNPNITDTLDPDSTMTHHFGELLKVGAHRWRWLGMAAQRYIDSPEDNPGDIRSGYLAVNLGRALQRGRLTPTDATRIVEWAFVLGDGPAPPFGVLDTGGYLSWKDYRVDQWVAAFNRAHPAAPIPLG